MIRRPRSEYHKDAAAAAAADTVYVTVDAVQPGGCLGPRHLPQVVEQRQSRSMFSLPAPSNNPYSQFNEAADAFDETGERLPVICVFRG